MTLKISYERTGSHRTIETRAFKNFNHHHFLDDVAQQPWNKLFSETNPEAMWDVWKDLFMEIVDRHAPLQNKRVSNKHSPWITCELTRKIYKRNYMKKIAIQENSATAWQRYKQARNKIKTMPLNRQRNSSLLLLWNSKKVNLQFYSFNVKPDWIKR